MSKKYVKVKGEINSRYHNKNTKPKDLYSQKVNNLSLKMNKEKILAFLLRNVTEKHSINQIAQEIKISVGSAHKILKDLEKHKIVVADKIANALLYKINFESQEAKKLCELLLIKDAIQRLEDNKHAKIYSEDLKQLESLAKIVILFGSILTKKEKARDIDVLFVASKNKVEEIVDKCAEISKLHTKTITPLIMTLRDLREKINEKDKVVMSILKEGILLFGEDKLVGMLKP